MKKVLIFILIFLIAFPLFSEEVSYNQEKFNINFIKNSIISTFGREPTTNEYSHWLSYLDNGGEKIKMLELLRDSDEYLRKNKPKGIVKKIEINVLAKPFTRSIIMETLMAGDKFNIIGRKGEFYKISFQKGYYTSKGYILRGGVKVIYPTQKINSDRTKKTNIDDIIENLSIKLKDARENLLNCLLMDGKSFLFQYRIGKAILGEKYREKYEKLLKNFLINLKVKFSYAPFKFRGVLIDISDEDIVNYKILQKFDNLQKIGINRVVFKLFNRGFTPIIFHPFLKNCKLEFKKLMGRYIDETKKRGLKSYFYMSGFNFGKIYEREFGENMAINGLGFTTSTYYNKLFLADHIINSVRKKFFDLFKVFASTRYFSGFFVSSIFYPETPNIKNDIRALFNFNKKSIRKFENDTGLSMSMLNSDQEKIFKNWLRNNQSEFLSNLKKLANSYGNKLGIFVPSFVLNNQKNDFLNFSTDYYLINIKHLRKKKVKVFDNIIVYYGKSESSKKISSIEEELEKLKKSYPTIVGWLIDKSD